MLPSISLGLLGLPFFTLINTSDYIHNVMAISLTVQKFNLKTKLSLQSKCLNFGKKFCGSIPKISTGSANSSSSSSMNFHEWLDSLYELKTTQPIGLAMRYESEMLSQAESHGGQSQSQIEIQNQNQLLAVQINLPTSFSSGLRTQSQRQNRQESETGPGLEAVTKTLVTYKKSEDDIESSEPIININSTMSNPNMIDTKKPYLLIQLPGKESQSDLTNLVNGDLNDIKNVNFTNMSRLSIKMGKHDTNTLLVSLKGAGLIAYVLPEVGNSRKLNDIDRHLVASLKKHVWKSIALGNVEEICGLNDLRRAYDTDSDVQLQCDIIFAWFKDFIDNDFDKGKFDIVRKVNNILNLNLVRISGMSNEEFKQKLFELVKLILELKTKDRIKLLTSSLINNPTVAGPGPSKTATSSEPGPSTATVNFGGRNRDKEKMLNGIILKNTNNTGNANLNRFKSWEERKARAIARINVRSRESNSEIDYKPDSEEGTIGQKPKGVMIEIPSNRNNYNIKVDQ